MGPAGECFPLAYLGLAVQQWGLHSHHAHYSLVLVVIRPGPQPQVCWPTWHLHSPRVCFLGSSVCLWSIGLTLSHHVWLSHQTELISPAYVPTPLCHRPSVSKQTLGKAWNERIFSA